MEAIEILGKDLIQSVQQSYIQEFPVQIKTEAIKKAFSGNINEE